ncbi:MAG: DUF3750 domain-containing protein [Pseudomonadales bacterium]|nr:DUF3750 domain-containing protein [Pseudomonadales bacterium]
MMRFAIILLVGGAILFFTALTTSAVLKPTPIGPSVAPDPQTHRGAVVQVYGADVWGVRGHFAIHTWIATKDVDENTYTIYQVIGWRLRREGTAVSITKGSPDRPWFRSSPLLLHELRGVEAEVLIPKISEAAKSYPYDREYVMWPGPNSNSFIEWIALEVPELGLSLPAKAIGKNWMQDTYPSLSASTHDTR